MSAAISVREAVRLAKNALGDVPLHEMVAWIATNCGLTVKPVIVTVMLGSLEEREHLDRSARLARELLEKVKSEGPSEQPRRKAKTGSSGPAAAASVEGDSPGLNVRKSPANGDEQASAKRSSARDCPACGSGDYVFRGRRKVVPTPGEGAAGLETKYHCRTCGHAWKVRVESAAC